MPPPNSPPPTSLHDCLWLVGLSLLMGGVFFLLGRTEKARAIATKRFIALLSLRKTSLPVEPAIAAKAVRGYSRSLVAFCLCWLPWLAMILGSIGVSLIRDAGFLIIPWAILLPSVLFVASYLFAARLKFQRLCRGLLVAPVE